ncbi:hypothetical protein BC832DRAFT_621262 [Gaertneriomyces semiglobifer]|nr:hypothetical protein BC832DRAFT_621262 [Gaertneriomyces semiglobifer]
MALAMMAAGATATATLALADAGPDVAFTYGTLTFVPDTEVYWRLYGLSDKDLLGSLDDFELQIGQTVSVRLSTPDSDLGTSDPLIGEHAGRRSLTDKSALLDYLSHAAVPIGKTDPIPIASFKVSRDVAAALFTGEDLTVHWMPAIDPMSFPHRRFDIVLNATTTSAGTVPPLAAKSSAGSHSMTSPFLAAGGVLVSLLSVACSLYM